MNKFSSIWKWPNYYRKTGSMVWSPPFLWKYKCGKNNKISKKVEK